MTFAELVAAVREFAPTLHVSVGVTCSAGGYAGPSLAYEWRIYVDGYGYGATCSTAEEALEDLRNRMGGTTEQQVDPIEPPAALSIPRVPETEPDVEHPETEAAPAPGETLAGTLPEEPWF